MTKSQSIKERFQNSVISNYGRFDLVVSEARGVEVFDVEGRRYLDMGCGIAVNCLGHAHPEIVETLTSQASRLGHISNLYYFEEQVTLAENICSRMGGGKTFFCNSGAEANEALIKLARRFGHPNGKCEIITTTNSFHGRTLATIAATGQEKVKSGFGPAVDGFQHVPFNDLEAMAQAINEKSAAILIEGVQGEGGLTPATSNYLKGIRKLCTDHQILFLMDGVQCGMYRTGNFQSIQRILNLEEGNLSPFLPDAISMAKSLGGGFPIGAIWTSPHTMDLLGPGSHGTTYGGNPLASAVASKIFDIIKRDNLNENVLKLEIYLNQKLQELADRYPDAISGVTGLGFMTGLALNTQASVFQSNKDLPASLQLCFAAQNDGLLLIPAGPKVLRYLPAYNINQEHIDESISILDSVLGSIHSQCKTQ